ncbi:type II toxin-antitoxin system VapC family toxin [Candidatus Palauibacter sp.]|uniref:type II toxin-antitoxin system VapC family toxin n=1 Tax=Candidatus Palauibacter sp. TaxID=3101350 RepID=UPI003AF261DC
MIVLDTHVLVWAVNGDPRLGPAAGAAIEPEGRDHRVGVSAITPWEIALLTHRGRLRLEREVGEWIDAALQLPGISLLPIKPAIAVASVRLPDSLPADPADRLIVATARYHGVPLLTADRKILAYGAEGHLDTLDARN